MRTLVGFLVDTVPLCTANDFWVTKGGLALSNFKLGTGWWLKCGSCSVCWLRKRGKSNHCRIQSTIRTIDSLIEELTCLVNKKPTYSNLINHLNRGRRELQNFLMSQFKLLAIWPVESSHELQYELVLKVAWYQAKKSFVASVEKVKKERKPLASSIFSYELSQAQLRLARLASFSYELNPRPPLHLKVVNLSSLLKSWNFDNWLMNKCGDVSSYVTSLFLVACIPPSPDFLRRNFKLYNNWKTQNQFSKGGKNSSAKNLGMEGCRPPGIN